MHTEQMTAPKAPRQNKISVALDRYPDVERMMERFRKENQGTTITHLTITALREWLTKHGFARKSDPKIESAKR